MEKTAVDMSFLVPLGKSDHLILAFTFQCNTDETEKTFVKPLYTCGNYEEMEKELKDDCYTILKDSDVQTSRNMLLQRLEQASQRHIPIKTH